MKELKISDKYSIGNDKYKTNYILEENEFKHLNVCMIEIKEKYNRYHHINTTLSIENFNEKAIIIDLEFGDKITLHENYKNFLVLEMQDEKINVKINIVKNNLFDTEVFYITKSKDRYFYTDKKKNQTFEITKENKEIFNILNDENIDNNNLFIKGMELFSKVDFFVSILEELKSVNSESILKDRKIFDLAKEAFSYFTAQKNKNNNLKNI